MPIPARVDDPRAGARRPGCAAPRPPVAVPARASVRTGGTATGELDIFIICQTFCMSWTRACVHSKQVMCPSAVDPAGMHRASSAGSSAAHGGAYTMTNRQVVSRAGAVVSRARAGRMRDLVAPRVLRRESGARRRKRPGSPPCLRTSCLSLSRGVSGHARPPLWSERARSGTRARSVSAPAICWRSACRGWTTCRGCARASPRPAPSRCRTSARSRQPASPRPSCVIASSNGWGRRCCAIRR